ncbi:MAG: serine hydrolase domain-containing protein [Kofleriaceae bacterium]
MKLAWIGVALVACGGSPAPAPAPTPAAPPPAPAPVAVKSLDGIWRGVLGGQLHVQIRITGEQCTLDSLDQHAMGIPCGNVVAKPTELTFDVPLVKGSFKGTVSADANTVTGQWTQPAGSAPLTLTREDKAIEAPALKLDPQMDAVDVEKIQAVLDSDLAPLSSTVFAPATGIGVTVGIVEHGTRKIFTYGSMKPDTVFEIGSITKTFTGLVLAQMVEQKQVKLDQPVRELLPKGTVTAPATGSEITLLDLSAQRSGLPPMPDNFKPKDLDNPYADYDAKALYAFMTGHGVALPDKPEFKYSNLGVGLLGQALANRANSSYEALVKKQVLIPLGMKDTVVKLTPALVKRFAVGHDGTGKAVHAWDLDGLAGAGALRSTAADMLTYLEAQLHPDKLKLKSAEGKTLPAAITASHEVRGDAMPGMHIALNWLRLDETGMYWHNGGTAGFNSFAMFDPVRDFGVIVLVDQFDEEKALADQIGKHIVQRLIGKPAPTVGQ